MINKEEIFKPYSGLVAWFEVEKNMPCFENWLHYCHVHLPFRLDLLDEGAVIQGLHCLTFCLHHLDKGTVWSGSTLFAIPFASFGWRSSLIRVYTFATPFASFGWRSSLIRVYTVCHSICIVWMKEQSDQGLHCLPFRLHCLDEGAVWSGSTLPFHWLRLDEGAVWSEFKLFASPSALFGCRSSLVRVYTVCNSFCIF